MAIYGEPSMTDIINVLLIKFTFAGVAYALLLKYKPEHALPVATAILDA